MKIKIINPSFFTWLLWQKTDTDFAPFLLLHQLSLGPGGLQSSLLINYAKSTHERSSRCQTSRWMGFWFDRWIHPHATAQDRHLLHQSPWKTLSLTNYLSSFILLQKPNWTFQSKAKRSRLGGFMLVSRRRSRSSLWHRRWFVQENHKSINDKRNQWATSQQSI